jgi:hypothetical protein
MLFANVGLPMIFVELPFLAIAILPVAVVEGTFYFWWLPVPWRQAVWGALRANLWSTFVGVPFAWLVQLFCQMAVGGGAAWGMDTPLDRLAAVTVQSAWLIPYQDELFWMIPAAAMSLMVPCLLVSIAVELSWLRSYWPDVTLRSLAMAVVLANLLSYLLLAAYWGVRLILVLAG